MALAENEEILLENAINSEGIRLSEIADPLLIDEQDLSRDADAMIKRGLLDVVRADVCCVTARGQRT